jgi:hypothetical protein
MISPATSLPPQIPVLRVGHFKRAEVGSLLASAEGNDKTAEKATTDDPAEVVLDFIETFGSKNEIPGPCGKEEDA